MTEEEIRTQEARNAAAKRLMRKGLSKPPYAYTGDNEFLKKINKEKIELMVSSLENFEDPLSLFELPGRTDDKYAKEIIFEDPVPRDFIQEKQLKDYISQLLEEQSKGGN